MKTRIKKGDIVQVISGKDKGSKDRPTRGRVLAVMPDESRAVVEHVNVARKHRRQRSMRDRGGIVSMEMPIQLCKLMLVSDGEPTRVRIEVAGDGSRRRVSVKTGKAI